MRRLVLPFTLAALLAICMQAYCAAEPGNLVQLTGKSVNISLNNNLGLTVTDSSHKVIWQTGAQGPIVTVRSGGKASSMPITVAEQRSQSKFSEGKYRGSTVHLKGFGSSDAVLSLTIALNPTSDDLLVQAEQTGGKDEIVSIEHLYRWEKPVSDGGYMVLPHGSGYLIPADCPDALPGQGQAGGLIGSRWSMPLFGMVKSEWGMAVRAETWWDTNAYGDHVPGQFSALDFHCSPSLGKLAYPRRMKYRFAKGMDYVQMAKLYRAEARKQGLVRTLQEKSKSTPQIKRYVDGILFRWAAWNPDQLETVLGQISKLKANGLTINIFYPKWPSEGYSPDRNTAFTSDAVWQGYLSEDPVPGGWASLVSFERKLHEMGCLTQGMINPRTQKPAGPMYDESLFPMNPDGGRNTGSISMHGAPDRNRLILNSLKKHGLKFDVLYYDGYSAAAGMPEDYNPAHPVSRKATYDLQNKCFADTRKAGIMPGGELARFWAMRDCDYWFYTDWSADRLSNKPNRYSPGPVGEPIPLFELVFHDCYVAGFATGGYKLYNPGYDWWDERTPHLYELLYVIAPCHNWLPGGSFPYDKIDAPESAARWEWLGKVSALLKATKFSEMVSHEFLSTDRKQQRVKFANGVITQFDMAGNRYRVKGVKGFTGNWETPPALQ